MAKKCEECGERKPDVQKMNDPFVAATDPDGEKWVRRLCGSCATARHEES